MKKATLGIAALVKKKNKAKEKALAFFEEKLVETQAELDAAKA